MAVDPAGSDLARFVREDPDGPPMRRTAIVHTIQSVSTVGVPSVPVLLVAQRAAPGPRTSAVCGAAAGRAAAGVQRRRLEWPP
ncbi:hypothetical protein GCM10023224_27680 [Streptomonospora halophila]|uniref:Uncharacterized protein n=1 Tax=Streptomonospora halophila TaxID=427369 RepID=A0ABP9GL26_9ACTN